MTFDTIMPQSAPPKALVILLGWFGSTHKPLKKYAEIYLERDCAVLTSCPPLLATMFASDKYLKPHTLRVAKEAANFVREIESSAGFAQSGKEIPIIVHYFSNGGAFIVNHLEDFVTEAKQEFLIDLTCDQMIDVLTLSDRLYTQGYEVADSAPVYPRVSSLRNAIAEVFPNFLLSLFFQIIVTMIFYISILFHVVQGKGKPTDVFWNRMLTHDLCCRQAFLYSGDDNITDAIKLEELARRRSSAGIEVSVSKFRASKHVCHFKKYPDEYKVTIHSIVKKVVSPGEEDETFESFLRRIEAETIDE